MRGESYESSTVHEYRADLHNTHSAALTSVCALLGQARTHIRTARLGFVHLQQNMETGRQSVLRGMQENTGVPARRGEQELTLHGGKGSTRNRTRAVAERERKRAAFALHPT